MEHGRRIQGGELRQALSQSFSSIRFPALLPATGSSKITVFAITADVVIALALLYSGYPTAEAHIAAFFSSGLLLMLLRLTHVDASTVPFSGSTPIQRLGATLAYSMIHLALRGGVIAALTYAGINEYLALGAGIVIAAIIGSYSSGMILSRFTSLPPLFITGFVLICCALALRFAYLGAVEVIPQEAYYWNYAQRLAPGYLDHPPLVAFAIWAGESLFGHNAFGTRFGALVFGLFFIAFFYRYARLMVDQTSAVLATAFALILPYFFFGTGFMVTPDAGLALAWAMALFFFYRALLLDDSSAWYGVGVAMGIGMLSKYTIALLAPAALLFILIDSQSRKWLLRKEPYIAVIIALIIFSPVIYWNATHDWASFRFQGGDRFYQSPQFSLHIMFTNMLAIVTPLPLLAIPYLFFRSRVSDSADADEPLDKRAGRFINTFLFVPMLVFAWSALENEPRLNWTGPLWITMLPMLGWIVVHARQLKWRFLAVLIQKLAIPITLGALCLYAILLHYITLGIPGADFPRSMAKIAGWPHVARDIDRVASALAGDAADGGDDNIVVVGLNKYNITSKLAYYATPEYLGAGKRLKVTGQHVLDERSLMFSYWDPVETMKGKTMILLTDKVYELEDEAIAPFFERLSGKAIAVPIVKNDFGRDSKPMQEYFYRIGYGYRPPAAE